MTRAITISRTYGSGGREVGLKLAGRLGIPFYDKELIALTAKEGNIERSILENHDEESPGFCSYSFRSTPPYYQMAMTEKIYKAQAAVIHELAKKGPCVIVGRCANYILDNSIDLFIFAKMEERVRRILQSGRTFPEDRIREQINNIDKKRAEYHQYYSKEKWGAMEDYDICLNTGLTGTEGCVEAALTYISHIH